MMGFPVIISAQNAAINWNLRRIATIITAKGAVNIGLYP
jgi:hypothetical protein